MSSRGIQFMKKWLGLMTAVALVSACVDESPVGVNQLATTISAKVDPVADLGICADIAPPAGSKLIYHVYARGVQIYRWNGTAWALFGPSAQLFADAGENGLVGTHYVGPTWETNSGSKVVAAVAKRCTFDPTAVQWLRLDAVSNSGPGVFSQVKYILRVNTEGGIAPSTPGTTGQEVSIPYSTEYFFYRAK